MRPLVVPLTVAVFSLPSLAVAQPARTDAYDYQFVDDDLVGGTLGTTPPLIVGMPKPIRVQLLRPRASFVAEMLKSVEAL